MDFSVGVLEAEELAGNDGDEILLVVYASKVGHLGVEERSVVTVTDLSEPRDQYMCMNFIEKTYSRVAECYSFHSDVREVQCHHEGIELSESTAERVSDL